MTYGRFDDLSGL